MTTVAPVDFCDTLADERFIVRNDRGAPRWSNHWESVMADMASPWMVVATTQAPKFSGSTRSERRRVQRTTMEIIRNEDGTLVVPVEPDRQHVSTDDEGGETPAPADTTRVLHPGEGGYDEALAEWDAQQNPDRGPAVSTASGRQEAMALVHTVAEDPEHDVEAAVEAVSDPEASAEALRHVLVGGAPSVEGFAAEVAEAEGGEPIPAHQATKIIGEVLAQLD